MSIPAALLPLLVLALACTMLVIDALTFVRSAIARAARVLLFRVAAIHSPRCAVYEHTGAELIQAFKLSQSKHPADRPRD